MFLAIVLVEASIRQPQLRETIITAFVSSKPVFIIHTVCRDGEVKQRENTKLQEFINCGTTE